MHERVCQPTSNAMRHLYRYCSTNIDVIIYLCCFPLRTIIFQFKNTINRFYIISTNNAIEVLMRVNALVFGNARWRSICKLRFVHGKVNKKKRLQNRGFYLGLSHACSVFERQHTPIEQLLTNWSRSRVTSNPVQSFAGSRVGGAASPSRGHHLEPHRFVVQFPILWTKIMCSQ